MSRDVELAGSEVEDSILDERLRVWATACSDRTIRSEVLMNDGDLPTLLIEVTNDLTLRAGRFPGRARCWVRCAQHVLRELPLLRTLPYLIAVEDLAQFGRRYRL